MTLRNSSLRTLLLIVIGLLLSSHLSSAQVPHTVEAPQAVDGPLATAQAPAMTNGSVIKIEEKAGVPTSSS